MLQYHVAQRCCKFNHFIYHLQNVSILCSDLVPKLNCTEIMQYPLYYENILYIQSHIQLEMACI
jgi:hypothetical protein